MRRHRAYIDESKSSFKVTRKELECIYSSQRSHGIFLDDVTVPDGVCIAPECIEVTSSEFAALEDAFEVFDLCFASRHSLVRLFDNALALVLGYEVEHGWWRTGAS